MTTIFKKAYTSELERRHELYHTPLFRKGQYYPHPAHEDRIRRYKENKKLFKGDHIDVFERIQNSLAKMPRKGIIYTAVNLPGLICKKSADFLFGETPTYSAGKNDDTSEQLALERLARENDLNITNYETALSNAYRGDVFYKIRWGPSYDGMRTFIEAQNPEFVFPETSQGDANQIIAYHIAYPLAVEDEKGDDAWILKIESHYAGRIQYRQFRMSVINYNIFNEVESWKIEDEIVEAQRVVETDVPFPLVVHVPNYSTDDSWEGIDDLSELKPLFDELNNRLSLIVTILDKHSDPLIVLPPGSLQEDEKGQPVFHVARDKAIESMGKDDVDPKYVTWDGKLDAAYKELEFLIDQILTIAEIPPVALGKDNSGTSGASGLSIKWRMNSLLAKINRKRQYYDKALRRVLLIAQLVEHARLGASKAGYQIVENPKILFKDGLPEDDLERANIASIRTGGKATQSQLSAIMGLNEMTEEQARIELERIRDEEQADSFVEPSIFNNEPAGDE